MRLAIGVLTAAAMVVVAGCSTTPMPPPAPVAAPVIVPEKQPLPYRWSQGNAPKAHDEAVALFGSLNLKPGQYRWLPTIPDKGETKIVIDLMSQLFYVYRGEQIVGVSTISSGKKGKETQLGFWSVMLKRKIGYSRKYDNAPMPFMQMYDPKGLAFHAGALPGYPASHGCVRLPLKFAERLYGLTTVGSKVIIEG